MKLELLSLRAVNCGPLRDVQINFGDMDDNVRQITLLAGANGSGKTTILELIAALAETLHPSHGSVAFRRSEAYSLLESIDYAQTNWLVDDVPFSIIYGTVPLDADIPIDYFGRSVSDGDLSSEFEAREHGTLVDKIREALESPLTVPGVFSTSNRTSKPRRNSLERIPSILYFPYKRYLNAVVGKVVRQEKTMREWVYRYQASDKYEGSLDSYLIWLEYAEPSVFEDVTMFLNNLFPDGKKFEINRKELRAVVKTKDGRSHGVGSLSSGEQNLLVLLIEIRRRLVPNSVVMIDEIEKSLHPAFQHRLAQGLLQLQRQIPFQLIVTSHEKAFIDVFGVENTLILTEF